MLAVAAGPNNEYFVTCNTCPPVYQGHDHSYANFLIYETGEGMQNPLVACE
jgi:hypothetical protein